MLLIATLVGWIVGDLACENVNFAGITVERGSLHHFAILHDDQLNKC